MPADRNTNPIRCTAVISPSPDSAYLAITDANGAAHRFDLTYMQLQLFAAQTAEARDNWPATSPQAAE